MLLWQHQFREQHSGAALASWRIFFMSSSTFFFSFLCSFDGNGGGSNGSSGGGSGSGTPSTPGGQSTKGASKMRRDLINSEIANLRDLLPLPSSTRQRLSQLQLMALVLVYVRKSNYFDQGNNGNSYLGKISLSVCYDVQWPKKAEVL